MSSAGGGGTSAVDELVVEFSSIAGVDVNRARFYLESAGWDLNLALSSFFEELGANQGPSNPPADTITAAPSRNAPKAATAAAPPPPPPPAKPILQKMDRQIRTFRDLNNASGSSDSEEEGQRFFAGGSEHSGQQVLGPPGKKKVLANEVVQSIFEQARAHGATAAEQEPRSAARSAFTGTGFRLGADDPPQQQSSTAATTGTGRDANAARASPTSVEISLWHDGFTVDNGPLRRYDTPEGKEFLESIKHGEIPAELYSLANGGEVSVDLNDRRYEEYVPPKRVTKAFTGEGHRLGNVEPALVPPKPPAGTSAAGQDPAACEAQAAREIKLDEAKPTTNIQIRLADGTRLIAKLNHSNTVNDLRRYLVTARPQYAPTTFVLMTTFPNKELTEGEQSLVEAKLLGAVVVQKLK